MIDIDAAHRAIQNAGKKYDGGKPIMSLIPADIELEVAKVMTFGANKYGPENWRKLDNLSDRYMSALMRHTNAMRRGELRDDESGLLHSAHAICCLMFIGQIQCEAENEL